MRKLILFFIVVLGALTLNAQNVGQKGDTILNYKDINGLRQGHWVKKYYNGNIKYEGYFVNDKPVGKFIRYNDRAIKTVEQFFAGDSLKCKVIEFYPNRDTMAVGRYVNKLKDSIWHYYSKKKQLLMTESYKNGKNDGDFVYYYYNGVKRQFIQYKNGKKHGVWKRFYDNGNVIFEARYVDGMRQDTFKTFFGNGKPEIVVPYKDDLMNGRLLKYDRSGKVVLDMVWINGEPENKEEWERRETKEIDDLLKNRGKYDEPDVEMRKLFEGKSY